MPNLDPLDLPPSQEPSSPDSIVDLHGVIRLVLDKAWLIVSCVVLAVIAAAVYVEKAPRVYEALTTVLVEQEDAKVLDAKSVVSDDQRGLEVLNTVAQKLCNDSILTQVLEENHLLPPEGAVATNGSKTLTREETLTRFSRNVKTSLRRNTRLIDTTVRDTDPKLAALLANALVEDYLDQDARALRYTTTNASAYLQQEADMSREKLEKAEKALQDYRRQLHSFSLDPTADIINPQVKDLSNRLTESEARLVEAEGAYTNSLTMSTNIEELLAYPQVATDPDVVQIATDVSKSENNFVVIQKKYREKHLKYIQAKESLDGLRQQLAINALKVRARIQENKRITRDYALTSELGLEKQLNDAKTNAMQLSDESGTYNVLSRDRESAKLLYDSLTKRLGEISASAQMTPERIRTIQKAEVPEKPASPKVKLIFALAVLGGLAVGLGVSFVLESINTSFRTVDEVEHFLALPVLGTVPKLTKSAGEGNKLVAAEDSNSPGAEVFRTLRTTLSMLGREKDRKTYLFTSSLPSEGKTFTSVNYSVSLAQQGLRTLLMDLDLRRPAVEDFFTGKREKMPGVTDYFLGRKKLNELYVQHKDIPNLFWVAAGSHVPSPAELLMQSDFQQLLNEGLAQFDRIVIDTAPLLPVSDTLLLANKVQTVVLVVQGCKTSRKAVERSVQLLDKATAPIGGIVLNLLPNRRFSGGYYYSYYHGYGYGSYGYGHKKSDKTSIDA